MPLPRRSPDDQVTATFLRGLTIGALVGAVVAGSSMLSRRRARAAALESIGSDSTAADTTGRGPADRAIDVPTAPDALLVPDPSTPDVSAGPQPGPGTRNR